MERRLSTINNSPFLKNKRLPVKGQTGRNFFSQANLTDQSDQTMMKSSVMTPKNQKSQAKVGMHNEGMTDYMSTNDVAQSEANQQFNTIQNNEEELNQSASRINVLQGYLQNSISTRYEYIYHPRVDIRSISK